MPKLIFIIFLSLNSISSIASIKGWVSYSESGQAFLKTIINDKEILAEIDPNCAKGRLTSMVSTNGSFSSSCLKKHWVLKDVGQIIKPMSSNPHLLVELQYPELEFIISNNQLIAYASNELGLQKQFLGKWKTKTSSETQYEKAVEELAKTNPNKTALIKGIIEPNISNDDIVVLVGSSHYIIPKNAVLNVKVKHNTIFEGIVNTKLIAKLD